MGRTQIGSIICIPLLLLFSALQAAASVITDSEAQELIRKQHLTGEETQQLLTKKRDLDAEARALTSVKSLFAERLDRAKEIVDPANNYTIILDEQGGLRFLTEPEFVEWAGIELFTLDNEEKRTFVKTSQLLSRNMLELMRKNFIPRYDRLIQDFSSKRIQKEELSNAIYNRTKLGKPGSVGSGESSGKVIEIIEATYGLNCNGTTDRKTGKKYVINEGNATEHIRKKCDGHATCDYEILVKGVKNRKKQEGTLLDPAIGCIKDYRVKYRCIPGGQELEEKKGPPDPGWGVTINLSCP